MIFGELERRKYGILIPCLATWVPTYLPDLTSPYLPIKGTTICISESGSVDFRYYLQFYLVFTTNLVDRQFPFRPPPL